VVLYRKSPVPLVKELREPEKKAKRKEEGGRIFSYRLYSRTSQRKSKENSHKCGSFLVRGNF